MGRTVCGLVAASIQNGLLLGDVGFETPPLVPEHPVRGAKREQPKRFATDLRRALLAWLCVGRYVCWRERRHANGVRSAAALVVELGKYRIDAEEGRRRTVRAIGSRLRRAGRL